jgi:hypothetical protein
MSKRKDLTGQVFGRLKVLEFNHTKNRKSYWVCKCSCGNCKTIRSDSLVISGTISCGCAQREIAGSEIKHGRTFTPEYRTWAKMRERCNNKNSKDFKYYGGRGIKIAPRWNDFRVFYSDMGDRPSHGHSIGRVDNNIGYSPSNCIWATSKEQANNRRNNVLLTHKGKTQNINQWREKLGFSHSLIQNRLKRGWSVEKTLTTPIKGKK